MVLQVNGAAGSGWGQVDAIACQNLLVCADPLAEGVGIVSGNDRDI